MIIKTGYYGGMQNNAYKNPVTISITMPKTLKPKLPGIPALSPSNGLLYDYKGGLISEKDYVIRYCTEQKEQMENEQETREKILQKLRTIAGDSDEVTLMCFEKNGDFCHRYIAKEWLDGRSWSDIISKTVLNSILQNREIIIAGIGSRSMKDNPSASALFRKIFNAFDSLNSDNMKIILRSGGAEGADSIAEHSFSGEKQIILPWKGFNGKHVGEIIYSDDKEASVLVDQTHPVPERLSQGARKCLERDVWQILGPPNQQRKKTDIVICWIEPGRTGGTAFTRDVAERFGVPVFNVAETAGLAKLRRLFKNLRNIFS